MQIGKRHFNWGSRTYVMGVVNVTPDSFSGDGLMTESGNDAYVRKAVSQALRMEVNGADVIDVGGESTRPPAAYAGAKPVYEAEEIRRVIPVLNALRGTVSVPISIDTRKAAVARAAVDAGADAINDVSMLADPDMAGTASDLGVPLVIGHTRAKAAYDDVIREVISDLRTAIERAQMAGVAKDSLMVDPGIGFGKKPSHSLEILRRLDELQVLNLPLLVGPSRKSFIGQVLGLPVEERLEGTAAAIALATARGADVVRVHDLPEMARVARMADAIVRHPVRSEPTDANIQNG